MVCQVWLLISSAMASRALLSLALFSMTCSFQCDASSMFLDNWSFQQASTLLPLRIRFSMSCLSSPAWFPWLALCLQISVPLFLVGRFYFEIEQLNDYDIVKMEKLYGNRPFLLYLRLSQIILKLDGWFALRYVDSLSGQSEKILKARAAEF